ncbi:LLM class flavin-dependent oxidoreductase [Natronomonas gomsonensis]|uniref:LLM class flavin-dependent oxidoreductase n=1 Tax=Natronomonas gomsonensis TaxID=1046043 RepID=UPI0020CA973C|nr:LLM class flavin-dependent oxidoreductase [Natronomonas gomsonensis]MCY4731564.1 LLM class flavin-dependent oxidoreductase [Natronomonas gomsonensis]
MRIGVNLSDLDYEQMREYAVQAEDAGLDSVWVGETWGWEAFTVLGELAQLTDEVTLGSGIVPVYTRSPALLGQAAATVAEATDDRFVMGLGTSGPAVIEQWHGESFERPIGYTAETISVIRKVLSGDTVSHDGDAFELEGFRFRADRESGDVPLYVGALGKSNVRMAGAVADGWMPIFVPRQRITELYSEFVDSAESRDRDPNGLTVQPNTVAAISEDGETARDAVRHHIAFYVGAMGDFYHRTLSEAGYEETADAVRETWHDEGPQAAADTVTDEVIEQAAIVGTPEEAHTQLDAYADGPADEVVGFFPRSAEPALMESTVKYLGEY